MLLLQRNGCIGKIRLTIALQVIFSDSGLNERFSLSKIQIRCRGQSGRRQFFIAAGDRSGEPSCFDEC